MHKSKTTNYFLASAAAAMLAGCSGGSETVPNPNASIGNSGLRANSVPAAGHPFAAPNLLSPEARRTSLLFVADQPNNVVDIYPQRGKKMVGQITGLNNPQALATDTASNLYVANIGTFSVPVYAPPYTGAPKLTLPDSNHQAVDIAVSAQGVVAIANEDCFGESCNGFYGGNVVFFPANSATPCATVNGDGTTFTGLFSDGFDAKGNLYVIGFHAGIPAVGIIEGGCNARKIKQLTVANTLSANTFGIHVDKTGRIAIADTPSGNGVIYSYHPPKRSSLGSPVSTMRLTGAIFYFAFQAAGNDLYADDYINSRLVVAKYDYPKGGSPEKTITLSGPSSNPYGVAVTPPLVP